MLAAWRQPAIWRCKVAFAKRSTALWQRRYVRGFKKKKKKKKKVIP
jgi:hypothetical protein